MGHCAYVVFYCNPAPTTEPGNRSKQEQIAEADIQVFQTDYFHGSSRLAAESTFVVPPL